MPRHHAPIKLTIRRTTVGHAVLADHEGDRSADPESAERRARRSLPLGEQERSMWLVSSLV
jgi:hypothetical protein